MPLGVPRIPLLVLTAMLVSIGVAVAAAGRAVDVGAPTVPAAVPAVGPATGGAPFATGIGRAGSTSTSTTATVPDTSPAPSTTVTSAPPPEVPATAPAPVTVPVENRFTLIGDSIIVGAAPEIPALLPRWRVDADGAVGRSTTEALDVVRRRRAELGGVVVLHTGNNDALSPDLVARRAEAIMNELHDVPLVVWTTIAEPNPGAAEVNRRLRTLPERFPNARVLDWAAVLAVRPELLGPDRLHPTRAGRTAFARYIADGTTLLVASMGWEPVGPPSAARLELHH